MTDHRTKVLVVDDDELTRELFCRELIAAGYAVQSALDGQHAIRHMEETQFHVVLTDFDMPQMNGLELLVEIRNRWPETRVVLHSNVLREEVTQLAMLEGAYACLTKPYKTAQLLETMAAVSSAAPVSESRKLP